MRNFGDLQRMAKEMQTKMQQVQEELARTMVTGTAGGGAVTIEMTGAQEVKAVRIDPAVISADDVEMLQDLVLAAVADATRKSKQLAADRLGGLTGGLNIPGLT
ncbi:MAG: YbaB/EbfC family nucleoid-associated protein [Chloroflexi bacterium]|nr:MAG: YbaB/EbfC family nucleoid-associated protein [Chloroflexota bacterium]